MRLFTELITRLDQTNKTNDKVSALTEYFRSAEPADAAWGLYFLSGKKPKQIIPSKLIRKWGQEVAGIPEWLFVECRSTVGDSAETIALLVEQTSSRELPTLSRLMEEVLLPLRDASEDEQRRVVTEFWSSVSTSERFVFNKLISGHLRVGASTKLVTRALSRAFNIDKDLLTLRLMGKWQPGENFFNNLISPEAEEGESLIARPYPFHLAHPFESELEELGSAGNWQAEWKWDGIRAQIIKRSSRVFIYSRGEDIITEQFPEIAGQASKLPDGTVLDGEILPENLVFADLQKRLGRKRVTENTIKKLPVLFRCYDLLELEGEDIRSLPFNKRRAHLEQMHRADFDLTEVLDFSNWEELHHYRSRSRENKVEGLMLKRLDSPYITGRKRGLWWKWKVEPHTIDAVMIYAQKGSGRRGNLFTDYTFAVWDGDNLVPFAKAYSGLSNEEIRKVDNFVKRNTKEAFGPVRSVKPELVFEIGFEGIAKSSRHKSGIAVRFPRIIRWRKDKSVKDADTLDSLMELIK